MNKGRLAVVAILAGLSIPAPSSGVLTKPLVASWLDTQGRVWAAAGDRSPWLRLEGLDEARATTTSSGLAFVVDDAGRVHQWSGGGLGARRIQGISNARKLSCGPNHCLSLTSGGSVFQWSTYATEATQVTGLKDVVAIAAGSDHSLAATETGEVFAWGDNESGQLGLAGTASAVPAQVDKLAEVVSVSAGSQTSVVLLRSGEVVVWGRNDRGQLGLERTPALPPTVNPHVRANSVAASGNQAWVTTPAGELIELSASETAGGPDEPEFLGLFPSGQGAIALEEDGGIRLLGATTSRVAASVFEHELRRSVLKALAPESIEGAANAVIVIGSAEPSEADQALGARMKELGFGVSYNEDQLADSSTLQGTSLIVFAPSVRGRRLSGELADLRVPMLALDRFVSVRLGLTPTDSGSSGVSSGSRTVVVNAKHPIGRALGEGDFEASPSSQWLSWAQPRGADIVAVAPSGHASVFTLEEGAESHGGKTPERRAVLLLGANPQAYQASTWVLFDAAVRWSVRAESLAAVGRPGRQPVFSLTGGTGTILLVVGDLTLTAGDSAYKSRMEAMGFTVATRLASASSAADATGKKLVYVSGSSPNADILAKFLNVTVPVLIQSPGIVDDMLMTSYANRGTDVASTQVTVQSPSHTIALPLVGTVTVSTTAVPQSWGIGSAGAQNILAPFADSGHYTLFVYPSGASMEGANAPSRRVFYGTSIAASFTTPGLDLFERMIFWATGTNVGPSVNAGPDRPAEEGSAITLNGSVFDDGLPGPTTVAWTMTSGPPIGAVVFGTPSATTTSATFSKTGVYTLRLTANDGAGPVFDETQVTVQLPGLNAPPMVNAGADKTVLVGVATTLNGSTSDDGFPVGSTLSVGWSRVSGPGVATFGTPSAQTTTLTLSAPGTHVIRLTAAETGAGGLTAFDDVVITSSAPVLLVVGNTTLSASDAAMKTRFETLGFPVTVQLASTAVANDANGKAFVWASSSAPNIDIGSKFLNKGVPVVIQAAGSVDDMGMTPDDNVSRGSAYGQSQALVTPPLNWLAAGLSGTVSTSTAPGNYDWGLPAAAAQKVTALPSLPTQSTLFAYEAGGTLSSGLPAAGRRLFFGYHDAATLSLAGWRLFDQAVQWLGSKNGMPIANAGADQTLVWSSPSVLASLSGAIVDDGLPSGVSLAASWSALSGPAAVVFGNAAAPSTTATFTAPGEYILMLSATESLTATDLMTVSVVDNAFNSAPVAAAGPDRTVRLPSPLPLAAMVSDDGLPLSPGTLSVSWSKVSGSGTASFSPGNAVTTTVTFSTAGVYVLRVTASDGVLSSSDDVTVIAEGAKEALLVVGHVSLDADDAAAKAVLEASGFNVTVTSSANAGEAVGKNIVVISASVNPAVVAGTFTNVAVPTLVWGQQVFDDMGMVASPEGTNAGAGAGTQILLAGTSHPLAAFLTGTQTVYSSSGDIGWGVPGASAIKVATVQGNPGRATVFAYDSGSGMASGIAPARRVGFFARPSKLNASGLALFRAAIRWAVEPPVPALLVTGSTTLSTADQALLMALSAERLAVSVTTAAALSSADTIGKALIFVTATADVTALGIKLRNTSVPVIFANRRAYVDAGLTGPIPAGGLGATVDGLPTDGRLLYARLWSYDGTSWLYKDYTYQAAYTGAEPATLMSPAPGSELTGSSATLVWGAGSAISEYWVSVGSTQGGTDLYNSTQGTALSVNIGGLPVDGRVLHVRLWSKSGTKWLFNDSTLRAYSPKAAAMAAPAAGSSLTSTTQVFTWDAGIGVSQYWLYVGTSAGAYDLYNADRGTNLSASVASLPSDGRPLFVRLYSRINSSWAHVDYTYQAHMTGALPAAMLTPAPGAVLSSASATFAWDPGASMTQYWLSVGSSPGGIDLHNLDAASNLAQNVSLPTDGRELFVRLWSKTGSTWLYNDYRYRAHDSVVLASMAAPAQGSTLPGAVTEFAWDGGTGITKYCLSLGTTAGGTDVYNAEAGVGQHGDSIVMTGIVHPLSAGLTDTQTILTASEGLPWGIPSSSALSIATLSPAVPSAGRTLFGYEVAAEMVGYVAPDRRVAFPLGLQSASNLTAAGKALLSSAIRWALSSDRDGDGLGVFDEIVNGADPSNPDTNGDGILDGVAVRSGLSATSLDTDGDGLSNQQERTKGTNPWSWDTDGDGVGDGVDCSPLDPLQFACSPGDLSPPIITLTTPPGAILISSVPPFE